MSWPRAEVLTTRRLRLDPLTVAVADELVAVHGASIRIAERPGLVATDEVVDGERVWKGDQAKIGPVCGKRPSSAARRSASFGGGASLAETL